ncbi:hypothetical protein [Microbacterium sp. MYb64]|uniref:hypothetical protein n=1 Tax=Microbacterium sp. MYb64 TaxID=1848691 RepID=UPI000CFB2A56|nr:hypothetical protein [Microbacterium sp. MYb64]PRB01744.1 hypothetical protein CQ044_16470 [Microbacterium sp. MYb64]
MGNGYDSPPQGEYGVLADELRRLAERLAELETPTGTSVNSLVDQVQEAIANINTTVTAAISANSYTRPQIDNLVANPPSGSNVTGNVAASGNLSVGGTTTATGDIFTPNATPAVTAYTNAYINGDGRLSKGASSARYKVNIEPVDPASLGPIFPQLNEFEMRSDPDHTVRIGHIAEHLAADPALQRFVVYAEIDGEPLPDSIDFISLLLAQTAQLQQRVVTLEAQVH